MFDSLLLTFATRRSLLCAGVFEAFAFTIMKMSMSGNLFSSGLSSLPIVESRDSALAAWSFIPAQWINSNPNSDKRRHQRASRPFESARICIHLCA